MVEAPCRAKLLDFGLSRVLTKRARPLGGTLNWMAPELICTKVLPSPAADVFSYGRLIHFITTAQTPLANLSSREIETAARAGKALTLVWPQNDFLSLYGKSLAMTCLAVIPENRCSMKDVQRGLERWRILDSPSTLPDAMTIGRSSL
eukprot:gnl/TRDRNA2_/TRDRNA2_174301_c0_seq2.p1 gnl/TRDRNA2_/TRDRNA2_174301_c0~~gnl/TRDRNA2_/TRDRNA2_174301_c0_seq2.p1  ORF type:complete len:174 (+),score=7.51 gnl/TRDRNA2_/TRDRNA2_174301_c0_seq2:80-523(+)